MIPPRAIIILPSISRQHFYFGCSSFFSRQIRQRPLNFPLSLSVVLPFFFPLNNIPCSIQTSHPYKYTLNPHTAMSHSPTLSFHSTIDANVFDWKSRFSARTNPYISPQLTAIKTARFQPMIHPVFTTGTRPTPLITNPPKNKSPHIYETPNSYRSGTPIPIPSAYNP